MDLKKEYTDAAFASLIPHLDKLPADVARKVLMAQSVIATHGYATLDEMRSELGGNWVIARRTPRITQKYGPDVVCVSHKQYEAAERRVIAKRQVAA